MTAIRLARPEDEPAIRAVLTAAFPSTAEADLVERLVAASHDELALVAENAHQVIGYLLFSPVTIEREGRIVAEGLGLAPLAVTPAFQRQGIGTQLAVAGLQTLEAAGCPFVVVLGHSEFYRRFGFVTASEHGLANEYGADDAFMLLAIDEAPPPAGLVKYGPEFAEL